MLNANAAIILPVTGTQQLWVMWAAMNATNMRTALFPNGVFSLIETRILMRHQQVILKRNIILSLFCAILLAACQVKDASVAELLPIELVETAVPTHPEQQTKWENGPHADTYAMEKGPNTYCAKCHAPANWDPAATVDRPPNCVSCKFPFEASPRIAAGNPLVAEAEWADIGCNVCHRVQDGVVEAEIAWLDTATGYYEMIANATALCEKCHLDNETLRHKRELGSGAHADFVCTECHDAHDTQANCIDCHQETLANSLTSHSEYDETHPSLTCVACHDGSGLQAQPIENQGVWVTFRTTELMGRTSSKPYQSHAIQRTVNCQRCHYANNPWALNEVQAQMTNEG
jgi:hypothetical protein